MREAGILIPYSKLMHAQSYIEVRNLCTEIENTSRVVLGKASRTFVEQRGLPSHLTCILKVEPGKLDVKRLKPGIV